MSIGSTAAAADEHQRDDEDPDPVVIKHVAQTVIHGIPPKYEMGREGSSPVQYHYMSKGTKCAEKKLFFVGETKAAPRL